MRERISFPVRCPKCNAAIDIGLRHVEMDLLCPACKRYFRPDQAAALDAARRFSVLYRYLGWYADEDPALVSGEDLAKLRARHAQLKN